MTQNVYAMITTSGHLTFPEVQDTARGDPRQRLYTLLDTTTIERVALPGTMALWVDEEAMINRKPPNPALTAYLATYGRPVRVIYGNGVLTGQDGTTGLTVDDGQTLDYHWHLARKQLDDRADRTRRTTVALATDDLAAL
jgi:hypothetical protein